MFRQDGLRQQRHFTGAERVCAGRSGNLLYIKLLFLAKILITVTSSTFRDSKGSTSKACLASFQLPAESPSNEIRTYVSWSRKFKH